MQTIIIHTDDVRTEALKQFFEAFEVDYQIGDQHDILYNSKFVKLILERSQSAQEGNTVEYDDNLRKELFDK